jgi:phytol kinase
MHPLVSMAIICTALTVLMVCVQALARFSAIHGEMRRKMVHIGMGLVTLTFPWLFKEAWPVWLLAVIASVTLWMVRSNAILRQHLGKALHDVERSSGGELYFPWAVACVFWLAHGDVIKFGIPVLLLTLADAAGALAGGRYGMTGYETPEGRRKTVEGSVAVFSVAFLCAHLPLLLMTDLGRAECVVASLTLALLVMVVESVSVRGLDNLLIPLGAYFLLSAYESLHLSELVGRLIVTASLLAFVILTGNRTALNAGGLLGAVLLGYGAWARGGWPFLLPLLGLYVRHIFQMMARPDLMRLRHGIIPVLAITLSAMFWLGWTSLWPFTLAICAHSAVNHHGGLLKGKVGFAWVAAGQATAVALATSVLPMMLIFGGPALTLPVFASALLVILWICSKLLRRSEDGIYVLTETRFLIQALVVLAGSTAALLLT